MLIESIETLVVGCFTKHSTDTLELHRTPEAMYFRRNP